MKRIRLQLSEKQQLLAGIVLIVLLAISMLYCLGFASIALHQAWERALQPESETVSVDEMLEPTNPPAIDITATSPAPQ